ncbi:pyruvate dehydrogenase (acetyl-transferring) E1 component subunit alpha [Candidatus Woesearchaeota archaeon]|nr:pyruvate dehydrogenase (acetyl-transferring) E1 component subunit alpha [Candidatus Woesearchaeota archaeon]
MVRKVIEKFEVEYLQVMDEQGNVDNSLMPKISDEQVKWMYETMVLSRTFDDKAFNLQRQGRIGTYIQFKGQEGSQIGAMAALEDKDWLFPMYRSGAALIARKTPLHQLLLYSGGDERGLLCSKDINNFPIAIPVGTQNLHAAGCAMASRFKGEKTVSLVFMGDGATSKMDFLTGMNFAGVFKAPCIFVCENNQFAISVSRKIQTAAETIAQKSIAFGFKGMQVDGNDVFAMYKAVSEAVENARNGNGPALIEAYTYRMCDHSTSDDASKYRDPKEMEEWKAKDPIDRLEKYMRNKGLLDDSYRAKVAEDAKNKVEAAVEEYEKTPAPNPEDMFTYMFAEMPLQLKEQLEEYRRLK